VTDFDTVQKRLQASWYGMDFQHGVKFGPDHLDRRHFCRGDDFIAADGGRDGTQDERIRRLKKQALADTNIASDSGRMSIHFAATDSDFSGLLHSPLFQSMVH